VKFGNRCSCGVGGCPYSRRGAGPNDRTALSAMRHDSCRIRTYEIRNLTFLRKGRCVSLEKNATAFRKLFRKVGVSSNVVQSSIVG
jgi:hypothetical protein